MSPLDFLCLFLVEHEQSFHLITPLFDKTSLWTNSVTQFPWSYQDVKKMLKYIWLTLGFKMGRSNRGVPMSLENDNISKILGIHKPMDTVMFPHPSFWLKSTLEQSPKWTPFSAMGFNLFPSLPQQTPVRVKCRQQFLRPDQKERRLRMWEPACEGKR